MRRRAARALAGALLAWAALAAGGCSVLQPRTLRAAWVDAVPAADGMIESTIWREAPPLRVKLRQGPAGTGQEIVAELRALHDDRELVLLVAWPDQSQSYLQRAWRWDARAERYRLEEVLNDRFWVLWALEPKSEFDLYGSRSARYDLWQWQSGWTEFSGIADDGVLKVEVHEGAAPPSGADGTVYPRPRGEGYVSVAIEMDEGQPGTVTAPEPKARGLSNLEPAAAASPRFGGSVTDVKSAGKYGKTYREKAKRSRFQVGSNRTPGYWFGQNPVEDMPGAWTVEFQRLMLTADKNADAQLAVGRPAEFAVAVVDNAIGREPMISKRLKLKLIKRK